MRQKTKHEWQDMGENTFRAKVGGGWLVLHVTERNKQLSESMVYITDRHHEWVHVPRPVPQPAEEDVKS